MGRRRVALETWLRASTLVFLVGCSAAPPPPPPPPPPLDDPEPICAATLPTRDVPLFGVDFLTRRSLIESSEEGLVVVRLVKSGCDIELVVLPECRGRGAYGYLPSKERKTTVVRTPLELQEELPLSGPVLQPHLDSAGALRVDERGVGRLRASRRLRLRKDQLVGSSPGEDSGAPAEGCEEATHVVSSIEMGGFALVAGPLSKLQGASSFFKAAKEKALPDGVAMLGRAGDPQACRQAARLKERFAGCSEALRIEVLPLAIEEEGEEMVPIISGAPGGPSPFELDRTEVTAADYARCVAEKRCPPAGKGPGCTADVLDTEQHPINCVRWTDAVAYCQWAGKRLPTEAEWVLAAAGAGGRRFVWGDEWPPPEGVANLADETARRFLPYWSVVPGYVDGFPRTAPVGALEAGQAPSGIMDASGNVAEWTQDRFGSARSPARVVRGASFGHSRAEDLEVTHRTGYQPSFRSQHVGFRCARDLDASSPGDDETR